MKILVFSDSHLSEEFDEKKFNYLERIIKQADQVVINGDFWDGFLTSFDKFMSSKWKQLFPLLKSKHTVYIFGNHDKSIFADERVNEFSDIQTLVYSIKSGEKIFVFEHGNRLAPKIDELAHIIRPHPISQKFWNMIHKYIVRSRRITRLAFGHFNKQMKSLIKKEIKSPNHIYVCGHSHCAELDIKNQFINSGLNNYNLGQYIFINKGRVEVHNEWY